MPKPLLLLVDDDRAVLDALEAALRPRFEPVCRIETFENGAAVLEAEPRWRAEKRPIAVAIVDQKMPGITGVELLTRLREDARLDSDHPAAHLRAILLTGYAGLDSAIAAKNDGGVDRYIGKPWNDHEMIEEVRTALRLHLKSEGADSWYVLREIRDRATLLEYLAVRRTVYGLAAHTARLVRSAASRFETDAFDPRCRFLGLFREDLDGAVVLAGGLRVVLDNSPSDAPWLLEALALAREPRGEAPVETSARFPLYGLFSEHPCVESFVEQLIARGRRVGEPSRLVLLPEHRTRGTGTLIIEGAVGFFFFVFCIDTAVLSCHPSHRVFYLPLGFRRVPDAPVLGDPVPAVVMWAEHEGVPESARGKLDAMAERMRRTGAVCRCPTFPKCLPEPHATGRFVDTDLWCPIVAHEVLQGAAAK